jgi:cytohesin
LIMFSPDKAVKTDEESQRPSPPAESKPVEPVAKASQPEPPTVKAPDISIHIAARDGNIEAVKQHLAAGTDVNAKGLGGITPLSDAAYYGRKEIMELLIASGADANAKDYGGETPLDWAIRGKHTETADFLLKHGGKTGAELKGDEPVSKAATPETPTAKVPDTIYRAAQAGNIEAVKQHLAAGADVNVKDKVGGTPLHRAAYKGHKEIVELLIDNGADVNAERHETVKVTPIQEAAFGASETTYKTYLEIMSILIAAGADVNAHGFGNTVLEEVIKLPELVELLIANGADVNTRGIRGRTPLDRAINKKSPETADLLRKHGGKTAEELKAEGK